MAATIRFTLTDFGLQSLMDKSPRVTFVPSGAGVRGNRVFPSTPVQSQIAADGRGMVTLEPTDDVVPAVHYSVQIEHLQPGGQYTHFDVVDLKLHIPDGFDGPITQLPGTPLSPNTVFISLNQPPAGYKGWWLYSPATGQTMPLNDPLVGELRMVA